MGFRSPVPNAANRYKCYDYNNYPHHSPVQVFPVYDPNKQDRSDPLLKYTPHQLKGWDFTASLGIDRGAMLGKSAGGMLTIRKTGWIR